MDVVIPNNRAIVIAEKIKPRPNIGLDPLSDKSFTEDTIANN